MKLSDTFEGDNSSLKKTFEDAVKEDPFSDFMKSQGINVVDVTPTQKEGECICHARAENPKAPLDPQCPFHFPKEDTVRFNELLRKATSRPAQKEEWDDDYDIERNKFTQYDTSLHGYVLNDSALKAFIRNIESLAEARGRKDTITAFEEWAKENKIYAALSSDGDAVRLTNLLKFADSLKSNAPKV